MDAPEREREVVCRQLQGGDAVLLHVGSGAYHGLNETGAAIWELIDGLRDEVQIVEDLRSRFEDVPPDSELRAAVTGFLDGLRDRGLVH